MKVLSSLSGMPSNFCKIFLLILMMLAGVIITVLIQLAMPYDFRESSKNVQSPLFSSQFTMGKTVKGNPLNIYIVTKLSYTNLSDLYGKNVILIDSYMHAREPYSLQFISTLFQSIIKRGHQGDIDYFLQKGIFVFYPFVNADGYELYNKKKEGRESIRKNMNINGVVCQSGIAGVDINRNFPSNFGIIAQSSFQCGQEYRGAAPFSQNQAQVFKQIFEKFKVIMAIDIHSYGNEWIYPFASDKTGQILRNHSLYPFYKDIVKNFKSRNRKIRSCHESLGYIADGVYIDWALDNNALSLAFEVGRTFHSDDASSIESDIQKGVKDFFELFKLAELKYQVDVGSNQIKIVSKSLLNMSLTVQLSNRTEEVFLTPSSERVLQISGNDTYASITVNGNEQKKIVSLRSSLNINQNVVIIILALILGGLLLSFYTRYQTHKKPQQPTHMSISLEELPTMID